MKKIFKYTVFSLVMLASGLSFRQSIVKRSMYADISMSLLENIEALSDDTSDEVMQTIYHRDEEECSIYVGARGKINLLGVGIIKAGTDGYIKFDGKVVCMSGGNATCRHIECADLYEAIFPKNK